MTVATTTPILSGIAVCVALSACGSAPPSMGSRAMIRASTTEPSRRCSTGDARLTGTTTQSSTLALAEADGRLVAYVTNRRGKRLDVVDVLQHRELGSIALEGEPEQAIVLDRGRVAVSLGDRNAVEIVPIASSFLADAESVACLVDAPGGPTSLAASEDGVFLVVTSTVGHTLTVLDGATLERRQAVDLPRMPTAVLVEGNRAFVSHIGRDELSVVDLASSAPRRTIDLRLLSATAIAPEPLLTIRRRASQAYALVSVTFPEAASGERALPKERSPKRRIVVPFVSVDPGDTRRFSTYYGPPPATGLPKETPTSVRIDPATEKSEVSHVLALGSEDFTRECLLPRGAAVRASTSRLYVACRGIDEIMELDALAVDPMRTVLRRFPISRGPSGIGVSDSAGVAVAFAEFDERLDIVSLRDGTQTSVSLANGPSSLSASYRAGRVLFYRTNDNRIADDGIACASCHPDGGDDGITWATPEGPRQTPMLAGRLHGTEPYGWNRNMQDLPTYIGNTIERLGGTGLDPSEVAAIASFVERMPAVATPSEEDPSRVARGRALFVANGCASCHAGELGTDRVAHTFSRADNVPIDTPSLRFIGRTAPYFHDGRYSTLEDLLADKESPMSTTGFLGSSDREALARYLESL